MIDGVPSIAWIKWCEKQRPKIVDYVQHGETPERRPEADGEIGIIVILRQRPDCAGVARHARIGAHAVALQHQPVGPQIAELGAHDLGTTRARRGGGDAVMRPPVAQQKQVGDRVGVEEARHIGVPAGEFLKA